MRTHRLRCNPRLAQDFERLSSMLSVWHPLVPTSSKNYRGDAQKVLFLQPRGVQYRLQPETYLTALCGRGGFLQVKSLSGMQVCKSVAFSFFSISFLNCTKERRGEGGLGR